MTDPGYVQASKRRILDTLGLLCSECGDQTRGEKAGAHAGGCSRAEGDNG